MKISISIPYFDTCLFWILIPHATSCAHHQKGKSMSKQSDLDNHSNQLNPENDAYWESRGYDERPEDWDDLI
jgi:hypothetical protein